jgi:hypothetical protein
MEDRVGMTMAGPVWRAGRDETMDVATGWSRCIARRVAENAVADRKPAHAMGVLPDDLTFVRELPFLTRPEQRLLGRLQTRTHGRVLAASLDLADGPWVTLMLACHLERFPGARQGSVKECSDRLWSLTAEAIGRGIDALVLWVCSTDPLLRVQASVDAETFMAQCGKPFLSHQRQRVHAVVRKAYRWQLVESSLVHPGFMALLTALASREQRARVCRVLASPGTSGE